MPAQSSVRYFLSWAKERIEEMDATLESLEGKAGQVQAHSRAEANQMIAELREKRHQFLAAVEKQANAGEAAWVRAKRRLESQWKDFESDVSKYIESFG